MPVRVRHLRQIDKDLTVKVEMPAGMDPVEIPIRYKPLAITNEVQEAWEARITSEQYGDAIREILAGVISWWDLEYTRVDLDDTDYRDVPVDPTDPSKGTQRVTHLAPPHDYEGDDRDDALCLICGKPRYKHHVEPLPITVEAMRRELSTQITVAMEVAIREDMHPNSPSVDDSETGSPAETSMLET